MNMISKQGSAWLLAATLMSLSGAASAYSHPVNDAFRACVQSAKSELQLGNYDVIDRDFGLNKLGRKSYDIYFNVSLHDKAGDSGREMKVQCSSDGFGKVRQINVEEGSWLYQLGADT